MEDPQALAGAHVESAHVALHIFFRLGRPARQVRGADDDGVVADDGSGVEADVRGLEIHHLIVVLLQVDDAFVAKALNGDACLRVQRHQLITGRHRVDAFVTAAIGPVRHSASRTQARRIRTALALVHAPHPQLFTCGGIKRHDISP